MISSQSSALVHCQLLSKFGCLSDVHRQFCSGRCSLLAEGAVEQPGDDRQVLALIVSRQDHRVLVALGCHFVEGLVKRSVERMESQRGCGESKGLLSCRRAGAKE